MNKLFKLLCVAAVVIFNPLSIRAAMKYSMRLVDTGKYYAEATLFAPGVVPGTSNRCAAPAFSPDGKSVYFGMVKDKDITLVTSVFKNGAWTAPTPASFSGDFENLEPSFSPDGKFLVFASNRPNTPGGQKLDGNWGKKTYPGNGGNLWKINRTKTGWGEPELLPNVINPNTSVFSPAVTADGSVYFMIPDTSGRFHIHRSQYKNGKYEIATRPSFSVDAYGDVDPAVAPDESFLIFSSGRPPALPHTADLFIVFRTKTGWSEPTDLRTAISDKVFGVEARLSPDLRTLYFSNQRNAKGETVSTDQYIWRVDISKILTEHGIVINSAKSQ